MLFIYIYPSMSMLLPYKKNHPYVPLKNKKNTHNQIHPPSPSPSPSTNRPTTWRDAVRRRFFPRIWFGLWSWSNYKSQRRSSTSKIWGRVMGPLIIGWIWGSYGSGDIHGYPQKRGFATPHFFFKTKVMVWNGISSLLVVMWFLNGLLVYGVSLLPT